MLGFSDMDDASRYLWAKSDEGAGHGLLAHLLDVAAVALTVLEHEPRSSRRWAAEALGLPLDGAPRWIATLVGLHDFGKAIAGFQAKWPVGRERDEANGLRFDTRLLKVTDHACASASLLRPLLLEKGDASLLWILHVLQAISAHHGYNFTSADIERVVQRHEPAGWCQARRRLFDLYWQLLAPTGQASLEELSQPAVQWLAGLTSVSDWIGSNPEWFPLGERQPAFADYFEDARRRAEAALAAIGWRHYRPLLAELSEVDQLLGRVLGLQQAVEARPLQRVADGLLETAAGPALLLVEAPMGEGKTELALLAHLRLQAANQHRGLYLALPTRATGNALFRRVRTFLEAFAGGDGADVQLVHGGAGQDAQVLHLRGIAGGAGASVASSAWFARRRWALLSSYGVGTVDQVLFAALNVKHHFVLLWGLANKVVVFDEVHAYDTYTSALIEALLRWLRAMGCSVVLMSATLPAQRRCELLRAWGVNDAELTQTAYPRLLLADGRGVQSKACQARSLPRILLREVTEALPGIAEQALQALSHGGCGVVIINTVDRAQRLYRLLQAQVGEETRLLLFHARFPEDQRGRLEGQVLDCFGKEGQRPERALLVATQVAEQSLDIDFDFMFTDLAPVDLLLQRAGRLHRHAHRLRPEAHAEARLYVAGLNPQRFPELKATAWEYVYDPYILGRTWALLSLRDHLRLPEDIDLLVQAVYDEEVQLPAEITERDRHFIEVEAYGKRLGERRTERMMATNVAIAVEDEPQLAYTQRNRGYQEGEEGLGLPNYTRLGDESVSLVPVYRREGGWSLSAGGELFDPAHRVSDDLALALASRQIKTSRKGLVKHLLATEVPRAFVEHPLLRQLRPLELFEGQAVIGRLTVVLDEELGLVFIRDPEE